MAKPLAEVLTTCPHPKCGKPIYADHLYPWCIECGERLPPEIVSELPLVRETAVKGPESHSSVEPYINGGKKIDSSALMYRYRDAYSVARVVIGTGNVVKATGFVLAVFLLLASFAARGYSVPIAIGAALASGLFFYGIGVAISAQGQLLLASVDSAVNTSTLLDNEQKAKILALG